MNEQRSFLNKKALTVDAVFLTVVILFELFVALRLNTPMDRIKATILVAITLLASLIFLWRYRMEMYRANEELQRQAYYDSLTGIYNRGGLIRVLKEWMEDENNVSLTGFFIDLDDFKLINDVYGHPAGDAALCHMANFLRITFSNALVGRTGGDEFCLIVKNVSAESCAEEIGRVLKKPQTFTYQKNRISFTLSAGYAEYPVQARNTGELMRMMDYALYAAKVGGKHQVKRYDPEMGDIKRDNLGFNVKRIASGMPGSFLIYKAEGDEQILFANDHLVQMFECDDYDDFLEYTHASFRYIVHPDDLERVEESILQQIQHGQSQAPDKATGYEDYVRYRILTKTGRIRQVIDMGRLVKDEHYGYIYYVFLQDIEALEHLGIFS
ncbi:MAG: diguanylate cyclase domain-containing protein [Bilifractor sp.]